MLHTQSLPELRPNAEVKKACCFHAGGELKPSIFNNVFANKIGKDCLVISMTQLLDRLCTNGFLNKMNIEMQL